MEIKGTLIPIGGNEDKGENTPGFMEFIQDGILVHIVRESGGKEANIVIIPTASSIPEVVGQNYLKAFNKIGSRNIKVLNIQSRKQAEDSSILHAIQVADCILFTGGDQLKIVNLIANSSLHDLLLKRYKEENVVIAGTSAGAMMMSHEMIARGSSSVALIKGAVKMKKGLALIPDLIIDTHFVSRGRFSRLSEAVSIFPKKIGVGLSEDTGLIIKKGKEFRVIGSGMIILLDASKLTHNYYDQMDEGKPISMSNLIVHVLNKNDSFTVEKNQVVIQPNVLDKVF